MNDPASKNEQIVPTPAGLPELPPADFYDPVIEFYKQKVDRAALRENLKLTVEERFRKFEKMMKSYYESRRAAESARHQELYERQDLDPAS